MGIFSSLSKFGLDDYEDAKIIEEKKAVTKGGDTTAAPEEKREEDVIYDKHYQCPVCDMPFVVKCIKIGRVKAVGKDTDLKPVYDKIDPLKYDVITCDKCGYSSITRYYGKLTPRQSKLIKQEIGSRFSGIENNLTKYSYDDAIERYKLAMLATIIKGAKNSERGYTCLKLAWVVRSKRQSLPKDDPQRKALYDDELECIQNAYDGLVLAMANEPFPIAGIDENTYNYILADLARRLKHYEESAKLVAAVLTSRTASSRLKDEALNLKGLIKEDMKKEQPA